MYEMRKTFNHPGRSSLFCRTKADEILNALNSTLDTRGLVYAASRQSARRKVDLSRRFQGSKITHQKRQSMFA